MLTSGGDCGSSDETASNALLDVDFEDKSMEIFLPCDTSLFSSADLSDDADKSSPFAFADYNGVIKRIKSFIIWQLLMLLNQQHLPQRNA